VSDSLRTRSSKVSPTLSRSKLSTLGLLTLSAAFLLGNTTVTTTSSRDRKVVRRWSIAGQPRGLALGNNGTIYVGLADKQSVLAIDSKTGNVIREVVLDSAEIAATKELVTLRTNPARTRLYIANGSDESATILSLPNMAVIREITLEGETIRDALPDPKGRYLYLLGRRVHVYDADGEQELRTLPLDDPMAIAVTANGATVAVLGTEDFGNARATVVALYETGTFKEVARDPLQTDKAIEAALFAASDRALIAVSREHLFEKPLVTRPTSTTMDAKKGQMRMTIDFGNLVNSERVCLPVGSGPQIATLGASSHQILFAERRCSSSGSFAGTQRQVTPTSLYGVDAYAIAYDPESNTLAVTQRDGYLTIYRAPR
jgi:DNA-binding beta-propeller fold protein YncE